MTPGEDHSEVAAASGVAYARAGLLGNPSDVYGGKAIAASLCDFRARVLIEPADRLVIEPGASDLLVFPDVREATDSWALSGCEDGLRLLRASILRFASHSSSPGDSSDNDPRLRFAMRYETDIPRQVGLSGSSAIVAAALRALGSWFDVSIEPATFAELALAVEVDELGLAGGPMDRVVQAYEGVMLMDLREPRSDASYTRLDPALLPPLFVAWDPRGGAASNIVHGELRARWQTGDPELRRIMQRFRELVDEGVAALEQSDQARFRELMTRNFELRSEFFPISERDREMIAIAQRCGAAAKLCGSGGAIVGAPDHEGSFERLAAAYRDAGFEMIRPSLLPPRAAG